MKTFLFILIAAVAVVYFWPDPPPKLETPADATKLVAGVWTYTGDAPLIPAGKGDQNQHLYLRLALNENHTYMFHQTPKRADTWGKPFQTGKWQIYSKKDDTGNRFFMVQLTPDTVVPCAFSTTLIEGSYYLNFSGQSISFAQEVYEKTLFVSERHGTHPVCVLVRRDTHPFKP